MEKGKVCVTGGTGFVASWLIMRLLQRGYSVNATVRRHRSGMKKDLSFLTDLPGAKERLHIFLAEFENPESFQPAIEGCVGVFHVANYTNFQSTETAEEITRKCVDATLGILTACLNSKTVKKVVNTSSLSTVAVKENLPDVLDEEVWTDVDFARKLKVTGASYYVSKTMTERAAREFAGKHCLDLVSVIPSWIHGPFLCPNLPRSVRSSLGLFLGNENHIKYQRIIPMVHVDDVSSAHIHLFEQPEAKGRYICNAFEVEFDVLCEFLKRRYPQFDTLNPEHEERHQLPHGPPGAKERLHILNAEFENPDTFQPAIEGCVGLLLAAHPINFQSTETAENLTQKCVDATLGILRACIDSKTVKKVVYTSSMSTVVVYTSSMSTVAVKEKLPDLLDEDVWSDVDFARKLGFTGSSYCISKTSTERAALEFGDKHCLDLVSVVPSFIHGPFVCPNLPGSVWSALALFLGNENHIKYQQITTLVHVDDVASAHIHLFEHPEAKGRYICNAVEVEFDDLCEFLKRRYPQFNMLNPESVLDKSIESKRISSKKLLESGFRFKYGLEEMYDEAIECCKKKGLL